MAEDAFIALQPLPQLIMFFQEVAAAITLGITSLALAIAAIT